MENVSLYIQIAFAITSFIMVFFFWKATNYSQWVIAIIAGWLVVQSIVALTGFYVITDTVPPRFILLVLPPLITILFLFATRKGRTFIDALDVKTLTVLHTIRIPVELILFALFIYKTIPQVMTFEGRNLDIISGISAPFIYYFGFVKKSLSKKAMLAWNFLCLALLVNIVATAILSAPFTFQAIAFDQPNVAVLYFPFIWLPCCIVPLVFLSHLASIRQLYKRKEEKENYQAIAKTMVADES